MSDPTFTPVLAAPQERVNTRTVMVAAGAMLAIVVGGLFVLNGNGTTAVAGGNTVSAVSQVDNTSLSEAEAGFVVAVEDYDRIDYTASEEAEIALGGQVVCSDLSAGYTVTEEASDMAYYAGIPYSDAVAAVQVAIQHLCPEAGSQSV